VRPDVIRQYAPCGRLVWPVTLEQLNLGDIVVERVDGRRIRVDGHWLIDFASCNYLGLDLDPKIQAGVPDYLARWGTHPSWARMIASPALYEQVENAIRDLLGAEDVLAFPTLTHIHFGVLPALAGEGTLLLDCAPTGPCTTRPPWPGPGAPPSLAFVTCPSPLKRYLKVMAPSYSYSGPVPVASLATALLGLGVNERRGDELRAQLHQKAKILLDHLDKLRVATRNVSGFPLVELALANPADLDAVGQHLYDRGIHVTLTPYPIVPREEVGFRIQVTVANTLEQLETLLTVLGEIDDRFGFRRPTPEVS
jgi:7-keto-8-aminopelargonate synthetase-like enzyme